MDEIQTMFNYENSNAFKQKSLLLMLAIQVQFPDIFGPHITRAVA
jgi:hypothetical protein